MPVTSADHRLLEQLTGFRPHTKIEDGVGAFVDWLLSFFEDDLFEARTALVTLPQRYGFLYRNSSDLGWTDLRLPPTEMQFAGHGGDYRVKVHWQLHL